LILLLLLDIIIIADKNVGFLKERTAVAAKEPWLLNENGRYHCY